MFHFFSFHLNAEQQSGVFSLCLANCAPRDGDYANAIEVPRAIALIDGGDDGRDVEREGRLVRQGLLNPRRAVTRTPHCRVGQGMRATFEGYSEAACSRIQLVPPAHLSRLPPYLIHSNFGRLPPSSRIQRFYWHSRDTAEVNFDPFCLKFTQPGPKLETRSPRTLYASFA